MFLVVFCGNWLILQANGMKKFASGADSALMMLVQL